MTHSEHSLGDVIRQYRTERGFTQNELSEKISLSSDKSCRLKAINVCQHLKPYPNLYRY